MAYAFSDLQAAFFARGFDFLNDAGTGLARAKRFLNDGMHAIDDLEPWCYLQASTTGAAPVTISDLDRIESVIDVANRIPLTFMDRYALTRRFADLTITGSYSQWYYVTAGTTVNTFPVNTGITLTVRYTKVGADMSSSGDVPLMPDRFRMAIVDYAAAVAFREANVPDEAQVAQAAGDAVVARMRDWNILQQGGEASQLITFASDDW